MSNKPVTAAVVGAGHRAMDYAKYALAHPDELKIVGVADPREFRRKEAAKIFGIPAEMCFATAEELTARPRLADAVINGTMDHDHVPTTIPLLKKGYHVLLEKPISMLESEVRELLKVKNETGRQVMICHVLRYAPFYAAIRQKIIDGEVGDIINMQTTENVSYHHMATAFVRGKWNKSSLGNYTMLMAKCCHDLDLIAWMKTPVAPTSVGSFGSLTYFRPERAPQGSGERCLVDCQIEPTCPYSAKKIHIEMKKWGMYAWDSIEHTEKTDEIKIESLRTVNPYGRCVWRCDNDVVDHQAVAIEFADKSTVSHSLVTGTSRPCRDIHIVGTEGEIQGVMEEGKFVIRHPDARAGHEYTEEVIETSVKDDGHGGGDHRLVADFVRVLKGEPASISTTALEDSIYGHLIGFAADISRQEHRIVDITL